MVFGCVWIWDILWGCDLQYWHMNRDMYIIIICTMGCIKITFDIWELVRYGYIFKSVRAVMYTYKYISFSFWPLLWPTVVLWMVDQEFCSYCTCGEMRVCVLWFLYVTYIYMFTFKLHHLVSICDDIYIYIQCIFPHSSWHRQVPTLSPMQSHDVRCLYFPIWFCLKYQWEFQGPKMEVLYHRRPYFGGISPYRSLT